MTDTSPTAAEIQAKIHGRLTGSQRLKIAVGISLAARQMALTRLGQRHRNGPGLNSGGSHCGTRSHWYAFSGAALTAKGIFLHSATAYRQAVPRPPLRMGTSA